MFRVSLPASAIGHVDSAEARATDGTLRVWPMAVGDSLLEADLVGWEPDSHELEVIAYAEGRAALIGTADWDPAQASGAVVWLGLGPVGTTRIKAEFAETGL